MTATLTDALEKKRLVTLKAQMALRGFQVHDTATDGWLVARWNLSRYCKTLDDLEDFARQVGAAG